MASPAQSLVELFNGLLPRQQGNFSEQRAIFNSFPVMISQSLLGAWQGFGGDVSVPDVGFDSNMAHFDSPPCILMGFSPEAWFFLAQLRSAE